MKNNRLMNTHALRFLGAMFAIASVGFLFGCDDDGPKKEDTPELITKATLTFTPAGAGTAVVVTATDKDLNGPDDISVDAPINLAENTTYTLTIALINELAEPTDPAYNITEEVEEEGDEHMFFFSWTNDVFSDPAGNGNIDNRSDDINYEDQDANALPLGLQTSWTTASASSGTFRVVLKHQPGLKTETSDSSAGETDVDITFDINIE